MNNLMYKITIWYPGLCVHSNYFTNTLFMNALPFVTLSCLSLGGPNLIAYMFDINLASSLDSFDCAAAAAAAWEDDRLTASDVFCRRAARE